MGGFHWLCHFQPQFWVSSNVFNKPPNDHHSERCLKNDVAHHIFGDTYLVWHMAGRWARCQAFHGDIASNSVEAMGDRQQEIPCREKWTSEKSWAPNSTEFLKHWCSLKGGWSGTVSRLFPNVTHALIRTEYLSVCVIAIRFLESAISFLINYATQMCVCILGKPNYGTGTVIDSGFSSFLGCERWCKHV